MFALLIFVARMMDAHDIFIIYLVSISRRTSIYTVSNKEKEALYSMREIYTNKILGTVLKFLLANYIWNSISSKIFVCINKIIKSQF